MNTENFTQLTMEGWDEQLYREYDAIVANILSKIWEISHEKKIIRLYHFDRKNKEHLLLLRIALIARDLYDFPIQVEGTRWDIFCLNLKLRKNFSRIGRYKHVSHGHGEEWLYAKGGINVPSMLNDMRSEAEQRCGCHFPFRAIYETYYEGSM